MNTNIPIVQGYANDQQYTSAATEEYGEDSFNGQKGNPQPKKFNDVFFAILFYIHLTAMAIALPMAINAQDQNGGGNTGTFGSIIYFVSVCSIFSVGLSTVSLGFMIKFSRQLVQIALYFYIGFSFLLMVIMFMAASMLMGGLFALSFAFSICYARAVQSRIPFAAANLTAALTAVKANVGLTMVAYIFMFVGFGYSIAWTTISNAVLNTYPGMAFFLFLSFYWTHQVLKNTMHVTTAGVIGTWWFAPDEASSLCSRSIGDSFVRATTYSFGSICFGSLIVALIQALRQLNRHLRENRDAQLIVCLIDCVLGCIEGLIEYFNKWAYVYVGLYGYSYLDAGRNVIQLFQNNGWTTLITDDLAGMVLFMISIMIGLFTGLIGFIVASLDANIFADFNFDASPEGVGFGFGFLIGVVLASIMLGVVESAVSTCIVCFAESPAEFEQNHPSLSLEMREAWRSSWPTECGNM
eukprot:scaffold773_cov218-Chaetoceros_neogracile.AAC.2